MFIERVSQPTWSVRKFQKNLGSLGKFVLTKMNALK